VISALLAIPLAGEPLAIGVLLGSLITLAGIYILNRNNN
jgi:hypothetical protein